MKPTFFSGVAALVLLSACVDVQNCDPNQVNNVITSGMCSSSGQFDARAQNLQSNAATLSAEVEKERIAISLATTQVRELQAQQKITQEQAAAISREMAVMQQDLNSLSRSGDDPAQAEALRAKIAASKAAINSFANVAVL
jgi:hypothetical protein